MKSKLLSILPSAPEESSAAIAPSNQSVQASNLARYYAFLNQQARQPQRKSNSLYAAIRFVQSLLSFAIFVVMFLTILTLFGFGLSKLGVIAQVSPGTASTAGKSSAITTDAPPASVAPKRKSRHK